MRHLDLFTGILGFSVAAEKVFGKEYRLIACCEINEFCQRIIRHHRPNAPIVSNIKSMTSWLSQAGFPAKTYRLPTQTASESQEIEAAFGKKCTKLFSIYDPITRLWKTSPASKGGSMLSCEIWPTSGLMHNGTVYQLQPLVRPTKEKDSGLLPTPTHSQDYKPIRCMCESEKTSKHGVMLVARIGQKWPHLIGKYLTGGLQAVMMGYPENWHAVPMEMPLFGKSLR
jgi:hypothetical protein